MNTMKKNKNKKKIFTTNNKKSNHKKYDLLYFFKKKIFSQNNISLLNEYVKNNDLIEQSFIFLELKIILLIIYIFLIFVLTRFSFFSSNEAIIGAFFIIFFDK